MSEPEDDTSSSSQESATSCFLGLELDFVAVLGFDVSSDSFATPEEMSVDADVDDIVADRQTGRYRLRVSSRGQEPRAFFNNEENVLRVESRTEIW